MNKIFLYSNACQLRLLDATKIKNYLIKNGHQIVDKPEDADIIIFITCAVINEKAENSLNTIKKFQKYDAELIVAGCLLDVEKEKLSKIFNGKIIRTTDLNQYPEKIDSLFSKRNIKFKDIDDANILFQNMLQSIMGVKKINEKNIVKVIKKLFRKFNRMEELFSKIRNHLLKYLFGFGEKSYYQRIIRKSAIFRIRTSWGCVGNCSYCSIKKAVGGMQSKPIDECIKEFKKGLHEGYKHFVLVADDIGSYGLDINSSFPALLDTITNISGDYEITIINLNPRWAVKYIDELEIILKRQKIVSMLIPIQSYSSRILKLMYRFSDTDKIKDALLRIKKAYPNIVLDTHGIIRFPTETEKEFKQTLSLIKEGSFNGNFLFLFSPKTGTNAETLQPKVPQKEIFKRLKYAKKFLKKVGYTVVHLPGTHTLFFEKRI